MKGLLIAVLTVVVLLICSAAYGDWGYTAPVVVSPPPTVVHSYYPVGPVYAYPPPVVRSPVVVYRAPVAYGRPAVVYRAPVVYGRPVVVYRAPVIYGRPVVAPAPVVVAPPVVIRPKVYVRGQPVRNAVRAVLP